MESNKTKNKVIKAAKICYIVSKVLYILSFIACFVFIALAIILSATNAIKELTKFETVMLFVTLALYAFFSIGLLWNVESIFKNMLENKVPFTERVNHYIKKIALFTILLATVPALSGTSILKLIQPSTELVFPINYSGIIIGIAIFIVGLFFEYGNELQKKDDETL